MWLNEKPNLTSFVRRQIPADVQCDSAKADANQKKRKVSDSMTTKIFLKTQASKMLVSYWKNKLLDK
jgi:hypothetical protein